MKIKVELTFPKKLKDEPIIYYLGNNYELIPNIIEASFSTETGWAILVLEGKEEEIKNALGYLSSKKVTINVIGNI
ncbi:MAG: NIL domain-containing protein [Candidatus Omnitrophica bacterium]|nr:NIL domain-containing protein [Candidatus Omnitrophota bacterium]